MYEFAKGKKNSSLSAFVRSEKLGNVQLPKRSICFKIRPTNSFFENNLNDLTHYSL